MIKLHHLPSRSLYGETLDPQTYLHEVATESPTHVGLSNTSLLFHFLCKSLFTKRAGFRIWEGRAGLLQRFYWGLFVAEAILISCLRIPSVQKARLFFLARRLLHILSERNREMKFMLHKLHGYLTLLNTPHTFPHDSFLPDSVKIQMLRTIHFISSASAPRPHSRDWLALIDIDCPVRTRYALTCAA